MAAKGKVNIVGIVAWVLVGVLALAAGALGFLGQKQAGQAAGLRDALMQVATTAGVPVAVPAEVPAEASEEAPAEAPASAPGLTADSLKDAAGLSNALQQVQTAIQAVQQDLASTKEALVLARGEASTAKVESGNLSKQVQEKTAQADTLAKDLAAKDEALAAAKAEAGKAVQEAQAAQEAADKQKAELEGNMASLKARMEEQSARLQAELDAAQATAPAESEGAVPAENVLVDVLADAVPEAPVVEEEPGRVIGQSKMISLIRYDEAEQSLYLRLLDGQELTYRDVPPAAYSQLISDGDRVDIVYKFRIQGVYKSLPPDSTVVRKYLKWQRRNRAKDEVRVVEVEAPLVIVDEEPPAEEAAAAEPAEEAAAED